MVQADMTRRFSELTARLDDVIARLDRIESSLLEATQLRESLQHERESRRALAEQTSWLIEVLGDTRKEIRWLREERTRLQDEPDEYRP